MPIAIEDLHHLGEDIYIYVVKFHNSVFVHIRKYKVFKNTKCYPTHHGVCLTVGECHKLIENFDIISDAIQKHSPYSLCLSEECTIECAEINSENWEMRISKRGKTIELLPAIAFDLSAKLDGALQNVDLEPAGPPAIEVTDDGVYSLGEDLFLVIYKNEGTVFLHLRHYKVYGAKMYPSIDGIHLKVEEFIKITEILSGDMIVEGKTEVNNECSIFINNVNFSESGLSMTKRSKTVDLSGNQSLDLVKNITSALDYISNLSNPCTCFEYNHPCFSCNLMSIMSN